MNILNCAGEKSIYSLKKKLENKNTAHVPSKLPPLGGGGGQQKVLLIILFRTTTKRPPASSSPSSYEACSDSSKLCRES